MCIRDRSTIVEGASPEATSRIVRRHGSRRDVPESVLGGPAEAGSISRSRATCRPGRHAGVRGATPFEWERLLCLPQDSGWVLAAVYLLHNTPDQGASHQSLH